MKQIYLCQPYAYDIKPKSLEARKNACEGWAYIYPESDEFECFGTTIKSSMLCDSFNMGVASAKNGGADYFAMIHSDIVAPSGWLARLIKALEENGADMIHAAAMIKDQRGLTSTTIAYSLDPYGRKRRLSIKEVHSLPDVFTVKDIQEQIDEKAIALLPNPGCMVMRCGKWFLDWPGFSTLSRVRLRDDGKYWTESISEDYVFGYYAAEHGINLAVAGPRLVPTHHIGEWEYSTATVTGFECDRDYFLSIGQPPVGEGRWIWPAEVDGWLTIVEGKALAQLALGKRVLEIGSYCGKSTICMAQTAKSIVAVDPHDGRATDKPRGTLMEMMSNLSRYRVNNVTIQQATSRDWATSYADEPFDLVFIDGAHDLESVQADIEIAERFLAPDGVIAFHDYREYPGEHDGSWNPGVTEAIKSYIGRGAKLKSRSGTVAVIAAPILAEAIT
jgi:hypothetical protein